MTDTRPREDASFVIRALTYWSFRAENWCREPSHVNVDPACDGFDAARRNAENRIEWGDVRRRVHPATIRIEFDSAN